MLKLRFETAFVDFEASILYESNINNIVFKNLN